MNQNPELAQAFDEMNDAVVPQEDQKLTPKQTIELMDKQPIIGVDSANYTKSFGPTNEDLNPFGLNLIADGNRIILHVETRDVSKGGVILTDGAKKEIAEANQANNSKLYYITGVSENVFNSSKYRPGQWVLLSADAMGHSCKIAGKEMLLVEAYAIAGSVVFHEELDVESQYKNIYSTPPNAN